MNKQKLYKMNKQAVKISRNIMTGDVYMWCNEWNEFGIMRLNVLMVNVDTYVYMYAGLITPFIYTFIYIYIYIQNYLTKI